MTPRASVQVVLEVGGTHVSAAPADDLSRTVRLPLGAVPSADVFVETLVTAVLRVGAAPADVVVALPGPFDYAGGTAHYAAVGKFDALNGFDLGTALRSRLNGTVRFVNDADAFALGCWVSRPTRRLVGLTLGTGVGSGWIDDGAIVSDGAHVPPGGEAHLLTVGGRPLEEHVSRRAIRQRYEAAGGAALDVREICDRARAGEARAVTVLRGAMRALGETLAPWLQRFEADRVIVGGSIAGSWDVLGPELAEVPGLPELEAAGDTERLAMTGAAWLSRDVASLGQDPASLSRDAASLGRDPALLSRDPAQRPPG